MWAPLLWPGGVCVKESYRTVVSLVNPLMPLRPRGPTTPLRSTGDGLANTVVMSAMGTLQLMKMSVPPALPTSLSPFQRGSLMAVTVVAAKLPLLKEKTPLLASQPVGSGDVDEVKGE